MQVSFVGLNSGPNFRQFSGGTPSQSATCWWLDREPLTAIIRRESYGQFLLTSSDLWIFFRCLILEIADSSIGPLDSSPKV